MSDSQFRGLDLNLLRVFDALMEEHSVTGAAARLGITPSGVSHALNRLRYDLKDELFVRIAHSMRPTPRALDIGPRIRQALIQMREALTPSDFRPVLAERRFFFNATPYTAWIVIPEVIRRLRRDAPGVSLGIVSSGNSFADYLDSGRTDLAITMPRYVPERFESEPLLKDQLVWVLRADHPAIHKPATLDTLAEITQIVIDPNERGSVTAENRADTRFLKRDHDTLKRELSAQGLRPRIGLIAPDALCAIAAASTTDMAALVPRRAAEAILQSYGLAIFPVPYEAADIEYRLVWRRDYVSDPAITWLRSVFREAAECI